MKRFIRAVLPAFLLAVSVGQIYAFTNFSSEIAEYIGETQKNVQFAFSLGIFFLGMGAAFFGKIVEKKKMQKTGSIPGSGSSPGGGHSNPFQYSCMENPMDKGAWQAMVHRVIESWND